MIFTDVYGDDYKECGKYSGFLLDEEATARQVLNEILSCGPNMNGCFEEYCLFNKTDGKMVEMDRSLKEQGIKNGYELEVKKNVLS